MLRLYNTGAIYGGGAADRGPYNYGAGGSTGKALFLQPDSNEISRTRTCNIVLR